MKPGYTITYEPATILGERGFSYDIYFDGRLLASGWSRGKKSDAEQSARQTIRERSAA